MPVKGGEPGRGSWIQVSFGGRQSLHLRLPGVGAGKLTRGTPLKLSESWWEDRTIVSDNDNAPPLLMPWVTVS